jgi:pimeloyl-ACP methyl ester carboxylesterase
MPLTYEQFRYAFANAVPEDEARQLYDTYSVPGPGEPVFQAADENLNPWSEAKVDTKNPDRGPMLIIGADQDHTAPWAIAHASYERQRHNPSITEIVKLDGRGHALTIDHGWRDVAQTALAFLERVLPAEAAV